MLEPLTMPLQVVCFSTRDVDLSDEELLEAVNAADLVLGLGDVDLDRIAAVIDSKKPALCVLGDHDPRRAPPAPFTPLHGSGVIFKGWRIVGLSGGILGHSEGRGFSLDEDEAASALAQVPACDLLISHAPPVGLELDYALAPAAGLYALNEYVQAVQPLVHLHANEIGHTTTLLGSTLVLGVEGALVVPPFDFTV